jgi:hypothetical protein
MCEFRRRRTCLRIQGFKRDESSMYDQRIYAGLRTAEDLRSTQSFSIFLNSSVSDGNLCELSIRHSARKAICRLTAHASISTRSFRSLKLKKNKYPIFLSHRGRPTIHCTTYCHLGIPLLISQHFVKKTAFEVIDILHGGIYVL